MKFDTLKVNIYRVGTGYLAEAENGQAWCVKGDLKDRRVDHLPHPNDKRELLVSAAVREDGSDEGGLYLKDVGKVLLDIRTSMTSIGSNSVMVRNKWVDAHLDKILVLDGTFAFRLSVEGELMVGNVFANLSTVNFERPRIATWMNIIAEAVLRTNKPYRQVASIVHFQRPIGAYFA